MVWLSICTERQKYSLTYTQVFLKEKEQNDSADGEEGRREQRALTGRGPSAKFSLRLFRSTVCLSLLLLCVYQIWPRLSCRLSLSLRLCFFPFFFAYLGREYSKESSPSRQERRDRNGGRCSSSSSTRSGLRRCKKNDVCIRVLLSMVMDIFFFSGVYGCVSSSVAVCLSVHVALRLHC